MEKRLVFVITFVVVTGSAALVAFLVGYVAHYDLGLSRAEIRDLAFIAAAMVTMLLATESVRRRWHKPK